MGIFKKIGAAVRKNVNLKNVLKVATPLMGAIPIVGGTVQQVAQNLQDAHAMKKAAQKADAEAQAYAQAQADALQQQALDTAGQSVGVILGSTAKLASKSVVEGIYEGTSSGVKEGLGTAGAGIADYTLKAWFQKHWKHILMALTGIGLIWFIIKKSSSNDKYNRYRAKQRR